MKRLLLLLPILLTGCTTTENYDGTRTTRFDAESAIEVAKYGTSVYDRYHAQPPPQAYPYQP